MRASAPIDLLRCPASGSPLEADGERLVTADGRRSYPVVDGVPILIDESRSIVRVDEVAASRERGAGAERSLKRRVAERVQVSSSINLSAPVHVPRFLELLRQAATGRPRVLVIGGGQVGVGMESLLDAEDIDVISTDIYLSEVVSVACDGHQLPFADASFDGVVIQAVLEHVLEPWTVVAEIHRVLRPAGLVYADTPFMQQVHEGAYDFTRFTELGHRRLFRMFEELDRGVSVGPGTALAWSLRYFGRSLVKDNRTVTSIVDRVLRLLLAWLLRLDPWLAGHRGAGDAAAGVFFLGRRSDTPADDRELLASYRGSIPSVADRRGLATEATAAAAGSSPPR